MKAFLVKHPVSGFYGFVVLFGWVSFGLIVGPKLLRGGSVVANDALIMFPIIVLSVAATGILCTSITEGREGLKSLRARLLRWRVGVGWYFLALLIPPVAIWGALSITDALHSGGFKPGYFPLGIVFGLIPGVLEEIGWSGYLLPKLLRQNSPIGAGLILGILWSLWHLPVVNFLGAAGPHGHYFVQFALAFSGAMIAMRIMMVLMYVRTQSVFLAQLMHASSTGCLVTFSPPHIASGAEAEWYGVYVVVLAIMAGVLFFTTRMRKL
jgi:membrane protease YdiL (CAAX protease family)